MSKDCYLCGEPTQTPEGIHTPCLYAYLFPTRNDVTTDDEIPGFNPHVPSTSNV